MFQLQNKANVNELRKMFQAHQVIRVTARRHGKFNRDTDNDYSRTLRRLTQRDFRKTELSQQVLQAERDGNEYWAEFEPQIQEQPAWCYAATTVIVRRAANGEPDLTQRQVVTEYAVATGADQHVLNAMTQEEFTALYGNEPGMEQLGGEQAPLTSQRLRDMLEPGIPVAVTFQHGGHSYVAHRFNAQTNNVTLFDPLTGDNDVWELEQLQQLDAIIVNYMF